MTLTGVFESLVATGIWALLAALAAYGKRKVDAENERHRELTSLIETMMAADTSQEITLDLHFVTQRTLSMLERQLNRLYHNRNTTILIFIVFVYRAFANENPIDGAILLLLYSLLLAWESYDIHRSRKRIDENDMAAVNAILRKHESRSEDDV